MRVSSPGRLLAGDLRYAAATPSSSRLSPAERLALQRLTPRFHAGLAAHNGVGSGLTVIGSIGTLGLLRRSYAT